MLEYALRRILWVIPVIVAVAAVTFFLMYRAPGGPWDREKTLPPATMKSLDAKFGLDRPLWFNPEAVQEQRSEGVTNPIALATAFIDSQFLNYMTGVFRFDLGPSYASKGAESVQELIARKFPVSLKLGVVAIIFSMVVGIPLGIIAALRQNTWIDYLSLGTSTIGISVPTFVSGLLLLLFLSRTFSFSPIRSPEEWAGFGPAYFLPGIVLGLGTMAYLARLTRVSMLEIKRQDYIRTARAKGLAGRQVVGAHMLRNALIPIITILGPAAADLVTGSIIIESIFGAPGLGREFVESISKRDYSVIMGTAIFYAVLVALANVVVDLSYGFVDPRIRVQR
ncbi:MAG: oligopeptide transport system permease protein oppB [Thermomicrobiales bacterium]|jgi:oligopeptide transport system permease protein|nr:oligopeptide transport system permease protein oppB [Thermomicrobiales bacterium]